MTEWQHFATVKERAPVVLHGIDLWTREWTRVGADSACVTDPLYGKPFRFPIYEVSTGERSVLFAAGEFSNGVFGFYRPRSNDES